jgi:hypothetical protein
MSLTEMDKKERIALMAALILVAAVFAVTMYHYFNPPTMVWEGKVFETYQTGTRTWILSYGEGKIALNGFYDIQENATYVITYKSHTRFNADIVLNIEKIG